MNDTLNRQDAFEAAWADLDERLTGAATTLRGMTARGIDAETAARLLDKAAGVDFAIDTWEDLSISPFGERGDFAAMWRTFTDTLASRLTSGGYQPGYYQGIHLALTYQHGYGPDVDAPVIANPHA